MWKKIDEFVEYADSKDLDKGVKRDLNEIKVTFNEYEYSNPKFVAESKVWSKLSTI